jgi:hypothetical protein
MERYLAIDAMGSSSLERLAVSPLYYNFMRTAPRPESKALALGTALHMAVLEPGLFADAYCCEPDPFEVAPGYASPRSTKVFKAHIATLEEAGFTVLNTDDMAKVIAMRESILGHKHAAKLLERAPEREVSALWERDGVLCRGRMDALGDGVLADVKTTRKLKDFSPWTLTRSGYYRQAGWYVDGLERSGREVEHMMFIAIENVPPYDCGVFALDKGTIEQGRIECTALMERYARCRDRGEWPGMFPDVQQALLSDAIALQLADVASEGGEDEF